MKQGSVEMSIIKCLVLGIAGVGKTHLKRLLLPENTKQNDCDRVSTGLADNPVQAFVGSLESTLAGVDKDSGIWEVLDEAKLIRLLANAYKIKEHSPLPPTDPTVTQASPRPTEHQQPSNSADNSVSIPGVSVPSTQSTEFPPSQHVEQQALLALPRDDMLHDNQAADTSVNSRFIEAFKNAMDKKLNLKMTLVHFIDSGGQPQFLELMPAFVQDVSAILFAVNLSEKLDYCPEIYFYGQDGKPVGKPYTSPSSHKQLLEQCVRVAHAKCFHPHLFVVGTHRDKENECLEKKKDKDEIIRKVVNVDIHVLFGKSGNEIIWEVDSKASEEVDHKIAKALRESIVRECSKGKPFLLPLKWFALEMQIRTSAKKGILSLKKCLQLAMNLGIDEHGLEAALLHLVKYNLFLWYNNVEGLREVVFSDPQVILKIITTLVRYKHQLLGSDVDMPQSSNTTGVNAGWCSRFRDHAYVSHKFLSCECFEEHFDGKIFTVNHFINLMCYLCIMVPLGGDEIEFLMPALLEPMGPKMKFKQPEPVEPLLVCFPNECVPHGIFSFLVAFLQQKEVVKKNSAEASVQKECCLIQSHLHRDCVSFSHNTFPTNFTIIDSVSHIEVHLSEDCTEACPSIRQLIHDGIKICAEKYCYKNITLKDGFKCCSDICNRAANPFPTNSKARCTSCVGIMKLTPRHTVWLKKEEPQGMLIMF